MVTNPPLKLLTAFSAGIASCSDLPKLQQQLGDNVIQMYDYVFSENGLVAFKNGEELPGRMSMKSFFGEEKIKLFVNFCLHYIADLDIPKKRGTFIDYRNGLISICPLGRNCTQEERMEFVEYDRKHKIREKFVATCRKEFSDMGFHFSLGKYSFHACPEGWDKSFCLGRIDAESYEEIHFFGDNTYPGGIDYEIYEDSRTIGHQVTGPEDTKKQLEKLFCGI